MNKPKEKMKTSKSKHFFEKFKPIHRLFGRISHSKPNVGFQSLPADIIIDLLFGLDCVNDLHCFIQTSPFVYGIFLHYKPVLLEKFARKLLGDSWYEGVEVLIWQRNSKELVPDYHAVIKDLKFPFVLQDRDLLQLIKNRRWFESCRELYLETLKRSSNQSLKTYSRTRVIQYFVGADHTELFPHRLFYLTWLLHYRFKYELIEAFATRRRPDPREVRDNFLMFRIMFCSKEFSEFVYLPSSWDVWERMGQKNLFTIWSRPPMIHHTVDVHLFVRQKMFCHLIARVAMETDVDWNDRERTIWREHVCDIFERFHRDFDVLDLATLIQRYRLSRGE